MSIRDAAWTRWNSDAGQDVLAAKGIVLRGSLRLGSHERTGIIAARLQGIKIAGVQGRTMPKVRAPVGIEFLSCHFRGACSFSVELNGALARRNPPALISTEKPTHPTAMKNKYQVTTQAALLALALTTALVLNTTAIAQAPPGSLWYNGDLNYVNALPNEQNTFYSQAAVYDNFDVTAPLGWHVTAVFSDNIITADTAIAGADWEIRSGVSEGNAGTLIASGTTNAPLVTHTGRFFLDTPEYMVEITGLNVFLPMLPSGQYYWLNVTPVGYGHGSSANTTTTCVSCVGTPCGNDGNTFFNSTSFGVYFGGPSNTDFSKGVIGNVVPEPATV